MTVVDLFAGLGGWDLAARDLGFDPIGIEWDKNACATREAAGLRTIQGDIADMDPSVAGPIHGLIASPPCQAFSKAGKGLGHGDVPAIVAVARNLAAGHDARLVYHDYPDLLADVRSLLVVEPVRWAYAHQETLGWIAIEQVPPVLPLWEEFATYFRAWGFDVWTGLLNAADFGVPQTRVRAILMASKTRAVRRPEATHADPRRGMPMFLQPWVSMSNALGWGYDDRSSPTVTGGGQRPEEPSPSDTAPAMRSSDGFTVKTRGNRAPGLSACIYDDALPAPTLVTTRRSGGVS